MILSSLVSCFWPVLFNKLTVAISRLGKCGVHQKLTSKTGPVIYALPVEIKVRNPTPVKPPAGILSLTNQWNALCMSYFGVLTGIVRLPPNKDRAWVVLSSVTRIWKETLPWKCFEWMPRVASSKCSLSGDQWSWNESIQRPTIKGDCLRKAGQVPFLWC